MPTTFGDFAYGTASSAIGAGMGLLLQGGQDRRQLKQQGRLQNLEIQGQKEMTDYQYAKQLQMWKDTNYGAQMGQLKAAGLNPGLLYGMGGAGGATTGSGAGNVTGAHAPVGGGEAMGGAAMGLQMGLLQAQKENIEADTKNKEADTTNKPLMGENIKADTRLKGVYEEIAQVTASVSRQTINEQMKAWENIVEKGTAEIANLEADTKVKVQEIQNLKSEVALNAIKGALMKEQEANTEQDTKNKIQEVLESEQRIKTMASQLMLAWDIHEKGGYDRLRSQNEALRDDSWDFLKDITPGMLIPIGKRFGEGNPIKEFRKK